MAIQTKCPNCHSTAVRSRRAVYEDCTSNYRGRHTNNGMSFGFGKNFRPRLYFGGGGHSGTRKSLVAQKAAPVPMWVGLPIFLIICLFTLSFIISLIIALAWAAFAFYINEQSFEKQWICSKCGEMFDPEKIKPLAIESEIRSLLPVINSEESKIKRKKNIFRLIELMNELEISGHQYDVSNFYELKEKLPTVLNTIDAVDLLTKAEKAHFMGNKKQVIKYLLEALYSLRSNQVTVRQFNSLEIKDSNTGEILTINLIKKKILEAGYVPPKKEK